MDFLDRRGLMAGAAALLGADIVAPIARALAAEVPPGFTPSRAYFTPDQRALAAAVSERIIPTTDTPGAIAAGVPAFMEMMLADWYDAGERNEFMQGLGVFEGYSRVRYAKPCAQVTPQELDAILTQAMENKIAGLPGSFFQHLRQMVTLGYYTSEIGCKQERFYLPVPGRYDGKYPYADVRRVFSS
ncbi:MAG: gluconate 2-dehydrogenase subunit 3 family protein [Alphaproteobacteria bacterium]